MSKAGMPRWRYIALRLDGTEQSRADVDKALITGLRAAGVAAQLTRCTWPHAIVRVHHHDATIARATLPRVRADAKGRPMHVKPLLTSGTIRTITDRLHILTERGPRPPKEGARAGSPPRPPARQAR